VPPLMLQPLVENAITHGIATLIDGGTIRLTVTAADGALTIVVDNPRDAERRKPQTGVGPQNVRRRLDAQDDYVCLHVGGKGYLEEQTMADMESTPDATRFVRIHRSHILNIERMARVELYANDSRIASLQNGTTLPAVRLGYARLSELL
jgi:hypothetical protein